MCSIKNANIYEYCYSNPVGYIDSSGYVGLTSSRNYIYLKLTEYETNLINTAIGFGTAAVDFVILCATQGTGLATASVLTGLSAMIIASVSFLDAIGGNKGIQFCMSKTWRRPELVKWNNTEPKTCKNLSELWSAIKRNINKIKSIIGKKILYRLSGYYDSKERNDRRPRYRRDFCKLMKMTYDYAYTNKNICISKY